MANKSLFSWIPRTVLILVGFAVVWSLWSSLQDTRKKLDDQKQKMEEIQRNDANMNRYVDSLEVVLNILKEREIVLIEEQKEYMKQLAVLDYKHQQALAKIDTLWEFSHVNKELENAFPHWKGQFWEARRPDGLHSIIVPRFFGAEIVEIKTEFDKSEQEITVKDSLIDNYKESIDNKNDQVRIVTFQRDSIKTTYDDLFSEYEDLDDKYTKCLKSHWFKFSLGKAIYTGLGFGAGYLVAREVGK